MVATSNEVATEVALSLQNLALRAAKQAAYSQWRDLLETTTQLARVVSLLDQVAAQFLRTHSGEAEEAVL